LNPLSTASNTGMLTEKLIENEDGESGRGIL
jgi:hypothetical protein